jgi:hypothetical protein
MPKSKKSDTAVATVPVGGALAAAANLSDDEQVEASLPWLGFYSKKSGRSSEIKDAIPNIAEGAPFVCHSGDVYELVQAIQVLDGQRRYFTKDDGEGQMVAASITETDEIKSEKILATFLVYTNDRIIPAIGTLRGTKSRIVSDFIKGAANTNSTGWFDRQGPIGKRLADLPARLRVVGYITTLQKTAKSGFTYHLGRCNCKTLNDSQVELLMTAMGDEKFDADLAACLKGVTGRWSWMEKEFFNADSAE